MVAHKKEKVSLVPRGNIQKFILNMRCGFIRAEDGNEIFFHAGKLKVH